jgi:hypothetical protein
MREELDFGPVPGDEVCEQLGPNYNESRARAESKAFIELIRRVIGIEPEGAELRVKRNTHDFGTYLSVVCRYDSNNEVALNYAFKVDNKCPLSWDDKTIVELDEDGNKRIPVPVTLVAEQS